FKIRPFERHAHSASLFCPAQQNDLAFQGHLWVALDSTYAVRKIEAGVPKDININYVRELQLIQEYDWVETPPQYLGAKISDTTAQSRGLMLTKDEILIDLALADGDSVRSMLGKRRTSYKNFQLNTPLPDSLFSRAVRCFMMAMLTKKRMLFGQKDAMKNLHCGKKAFIKPWIRCAITANSTIFQSSAHFI
ncbi:MAG: hypothetical protein HC817_13860, partial [Saprospiraceae bacterium]|nr:hypothetical protein [Saprospiraceae bacterium]